jgi:putative salt-induced outer membrane protein YdiY
VTFRLNLGSLYWALCSIDEGFFAPDEHAVIFFVVNKEAKVMQRFVYVILATAILATLTAGAACAADEVPGWYLDADLALVATGGNSESSTLGLGAKLRRLWTRSELTFTGGATQTESSLLTRSATGTPTDFTVTETKKTDKTAELYFLRGWYQYDFSQKFFAYTGADWLSNKFAGIDSRFLIALGAGNNWIKTETTQFKTFYSLTYTFQDDVVENPFVKTDFPGFRLGYDLKTKVSSSTTFESVLVADFNLDNSDDIRLDWFNALPVGISENLLLKPTFRMLWRNQPSLTSVDLYDDLGNLNAEMVSTPLNELDTIFSLALVVKLGPKAE